MLRNATIHRQSGRPATEALSEMSMHHRVSRVGESTVSASTLALHFQTSRFRARSPAYCCSARKKNFLARISAENVCFKKCIIVHFAFSKLVARYKQYEIKQKQNQMGWRITKCWGSIDISFVPETRCHVCVNM